MSHMRQLPSLRSIQAFDAAARLGSFAAAAAELHMTPSAVSHQIRYLEAKLAMALFHRVHRGVILTDAGRRYGRAVAEGLGRIEAATRNIERNGKSDVLTVHCVPSLASTWLMPRLSRFSSAYPDIDIRLNASTNKMDLAAEEADFDIRYGTIFPESGVMVTPFPPEPLAVLCAAKLAHGIQKPADLAHHTLIHSEVNLTSWRDWAKQHPGVQLNFTRGPRFDRSFMSISAAMDGAGVTLESQLLVESELRDGTLVMPFGPEPATTVYHRLLYMKSKENVPKMIAFKTWLFEQLAQSFRHLDTNSPPQSPARHREGW